MSATDREVKSSCYIRWRVWTRGNGFSKTHVVDLDTLNHAVKHADLMAGGIPLLCGKTSPIAIDHITKIDFTVRPCQNCAKVVRARS